MPRFNHQTVARVLLLPLLLVILLAGAGRIYSSTDLLSSGADLPVYAQEPVGAGEANARSASSPAIEGHVLEEGSGGPVANARVTINDGAHAFTDENGYFAFPLHTLEDTEAVTSADRQPVTVKVHKEGYALWTLHGAVYYRGDTLRIHARLKLAGNDATVLTAAAHGRAALLDLTSAFGLDLDATVGASVNERPAIMAYQTGSQTPPATIRVYRVATGQVEVVPFRDYLKHVLPNEWIPTWSPEALKAGAMAVKTYAWFWISRGGKQTALGADLKDNVDDQVYDPNVSYASTDAAVDATFNYSLTRNGVLFQAQYCAGSYDPDPVGECPWPSSYMTQWGTAYYADRGKPWGWITEFYYSGARVSPAPPGGGYDGMPAPTAASTVTPTGRPPAPPTFTVGQGSTKPEVFMEAYNRNGGVQALGRPIGAVRWWLPYISEYNVLAQPLSGPQGGGGVWLVYDVLKSAPRAYVLSGAIAQAYATHVPPGPEWVGPPISDPFVAAPELGGAQSQSFTGGLLSISGGSVRLTPWPDRFTGWKAEYFTGYKPPSPQDAPAFKLPGQPTLVRDVPEPNIAWPTGKSTSYGLGTEGWSAQFTKEIQVAPGTYDFVISGEGGARLWVDGVLAVNGWFWEGWHTERYRADLDAGMHTIRVQYYSKSTQGRLEFTMLAASGGPQVPKVQPAPSDGQGPGALRVRVQWLGRQKAPNDSWIQPLTLFLSTPQDAKIVAKYSATTDRNGVAVFRGLPAGVYNVHVKGPHSLQTARASVNITPSAVVELDMKAQVEGDVDGDNCVTVNDFAVVQSMLGVDKSTPGFNPAADLNGDGEVSMSDVSLLRSGFDLCGDISADGGVRTMAMSTNLAHALSPWLNPEQLQKTLTMRMAASRTSARVGEVVEVEVLADTGTQPVDGAAFIVRYDANRLLLVDAQGAPAQAVEPGVALPAVMGNWVDGKGGALGYSAGLLQGTPPQGTFTIAKLRFKVLSVAPDPVHITFYPMPSRYMQLTNGGVNLLARASGVVLVTLP
jgi:hypothetical protein